MPWKESSVMEERLRFVARLAGRGGDDRGLPGVRDLPQDRLQDFRPLQGARAGGAERPLPAAGPLRQPAAAADREPDRRAQAREAALGRPQDPRAAGPPARRRCQGSRQEHHPCGARSPRPGQARRQAAPPRARHAAVAGRRPNDLWCADFKGEFKLGNGQYCYPLTVTDHASRFLLLCEALESTREDTGFHRL